MLFMSNLFSSLGCSICFGSLFKENTGFCFFIINVYITLIITKVQIYNVLLVVMRRRTVFGEKFSIFHFPSLFYSVKNPLLSYFAV